MERKEEMLERIRALKLPKNPLDKIIDKVNDHLLIHPH
jgi:hypothetical protein